MYKYVEVELGSEVSYKRLGVDTTSLDKAIEELVAGHE